MVSGALRWSLALTLLCAGCDLSYNGSCFTCDGTTACPSGLSCIRGFCQTESGNCGTTSGGGTTGGTTGATTGGTTGAAMCTNPSAGLCPPNAPTDSLACDFGCCPSTNPYACADTAHCFATADEAASDCADAGQGCSACVSSWCGSPPDVQACEIPTQSYCGNGACCDPSSPWYCSSQGGQCFATQADAIAICGNSCTYCTPSCAPSTTSGICADGGLSCGNACCDPTLPFYCAVNNGGGYCFASNAEAYQYCQAVCVTCGP